MYLSVVSTACTHRLLQPIVVLTLYVWWYTLYQIYLPDDVNKYWHTLLSVLMSLSDKTSTSWQGLEPWIEAHHATNKDFILMNKKADEASPVLESNAALHLTNFCSFMLLFFFPKKQLVYWLACCLIVSHMTGWLSNKLGGLTNTSCRRRNASS